MLHAAIGGVEKEAEGPYTLLNDAFGFALYKSVIIDALINSELTPHSRAGPVAPVFSVAPVIEVPVDPLYVHDVREVSVVNCCL